MSSIASVGEGEEREGQGEGPSILPIVTLASNILSPVAPVGANAIHSITFIHSSFSLPPALRQCVWIGGGEKSGLYPTHIPLVLGF